MMMKMMMMKKRTTSCSTRARARRVYHMSPHDAHVRTRCNSEKKKRVLNICGGRGEEGTFLYSREIWTDRSHRFVQLFPYIVRQMNDEQQKKR